MNRRAIFRAPLTLLMLLPVLGAAPAVEELPHWTDEVEAMFRSLPLGAVDLSNVADADASGGRAAKVSRQTGYVNSWHNYRTLSPGDYRATFRLKVSDNTSPQPIFWLIVENANVDRRLRANEFAAAGKYQDFDLPFSITRPTLVSTPVRGLPGDVEGWADRVTITMLRRYGDRQQLRLLGYQTAKFTLPADASGVLLVRGVYHEFWHADEAFKAFGPQTSSAVFAVQVGPALRGFPESLEALGRSRLVVLADVPAAALTVQQRAMLEAYVEGGGGLLVLGGPYVFGLGDWHTSEILAGLLPVVTEQHYDVVECDPPQRLEIAPAWKTGQAAGPATMPVVIFRHRLRLKPGAEVMVSAGGEPLIVAGKAGRGRVVAVLATPLGEVAGDETAWWDWPGWPGLLTHIGEWASGKK
ncbi:MAG TPA: hypothetical protein VHV55_05890 [Pirellulales bacterium]|nr:hypothetical protein [Pirellulales bacterium]